MTAFFYSIVGLLSILAIFWVVLIIQQFMKDIKRDIEDFQEDQINSEENNSEEVSS